MSEPPGPLAAVEDHERWRSNRRRLIFPAIFLVYLLQVVGGLGEHAEGDAFWAGVAILVAFCACFLASLPARWSGNDRRFWCLYGAMVVLVVAELPLAHQDAFVMCVYIAIVGFSTGARWAIPAAVVLTAAALFLPPAIHPWDTGLGFTQAASLALVSVGMWGFFGIVHANSALSEARAEIASLAAEGERNRIARDLHDLLGHSLTTITVKAGLARRLSETDPAGAAAEIREVEELSRRALADVRAAVTNYRVVSLAGELATGQEVLRATGIEGSVLSPTDVVEPDLQELFGWVVREGVTNVVRHSRASRCTISLGPRSIEIRDDGGGIGVGNGSGSGLDGLRERVAPVGGEVVVGAAPGGGWRLAVQVP